MNSSKIILTRELPAAMCQALNQFGTVSVWSDRTQPLSEGDILVSTPMDPLSEQQLQLLPESLRLIANIGVGTDHIDLAAARARGISVSNTPVVTEDTADLTLTLMLAASRRLSRSEWHLRNNDWASGVSQLGQRVHGKRLGIIGMGAIGQAVARRAKGSTWRFSIMAPGQSLKPKSNWVHAISAI